MNDKAQLSASQQAAYEELMKPDSNWPDDLRERFEERALGGDEHRLDLDHEVVKDYVEEMVS